MKKLNFKPFWGLSSKHLQIVASFYAPKGLAPPSTPWLVDLGNGDQMACAVSTPEDWNGKNIIAMIHGLGGHQDSRYMVRTSRQFYETGFKVVRINLRGCGPGAGLSQRPSGAGNSKDILKVLLELKQKDPSAEIQLIGFSLGGNTTLKLAGELGDEGKKLLKRCIAVSPPFDLEETARLIQQPGYALYHNYYLKSLRQQAKPWIPYEIRSIQEYDDKVSAPLWGFKDAQDYYHQCSSIRFIEQIRTETHILIAEDDPFITLEPLNTIQLPECVHVWTTVHGSHLAFIGRNPWQWMDHLLLRWVQGDFSTNE